MPLLYLFETTFEHRGVTSKELYNLWLKHTGPDFKLQEEGLIKYSFKVIVSYTGFIRNLTAIVHAIIPICNQLIKKRHFYRASETSFCYIKLTV